MHLLALDAITFWAGYAFGHRFSRSLVRRNVSSRWTFLTTQAMANSSTIPHNILVESTWNKQCKSNVSLHPSTENTLEFMNIMNTLLYLSSTMKSYSMNPPFSCCHLVRTFLFWRPPRCHVRTHYFVFVTIVYKQKRSLLLVVTKCH